MNSYAQSLGNLTVILGSQWGDEGKGKLVDIVTPAFDLVARATGGANAGHTIYLNGKKFVFHLVPSGMLHDECVAVIGNGVVLHLETMMGELDVLKANDMDVEGRVLISDRAHLLFDYHKLIDGMQEEMKGKGKVGTTKRGIGPCYTDKIRRNGIRVHDLMNFEVFKKKYLENLEMFQKMYGGFEYDSESELAKHKEYSEKIRGWVVDSAFFLNSALKMGKRVLVEGANGAMLDIDHGTFPYVTSSNPTIGGVMTGCGLPATKVTNVIGIMKAYSTRVGGGVFPTELHDELGDQIRNNGGEFGSTTGRPRRCGWFDAVAAKYSVMLNGFTEINLTKLDVLTGVPSLKLAVSYKYNGEDLPSMPASLEVLENVEVVYEEMPGWTEDISQCTSFAELPENAKKYVLRVEELIGCKITSVGIGVDRSDMLFR